MPYNPLGDWVCHDSDQHIQRVIALGPRANTAFSTIVVGPDTIVTTFPYLEVENTTRMRLFNADSLQPVRAVFAELTSVNNQQNATLRLDLEVSAGVVICGVLLYLTKFGTGEIVSQGPNLSSILGAVTLEITFNETLSGNTESILTTGTGNLVIHLLHAPLTDTIHPNLANSL